MGHDSVISAGIINLLMDGTNFLSNGLAGEPQALRRRKHLSMHFLILITS